MTRRVLGALFSISLLVSLVVPSSAAAATPFVKFVSLPGSYPGGYATATVATKAGASCSIVVNYMSGPSRAQGLYSKTAASNGRVSWTWKVGTRTTRGSWPVVVSCRKGGSSGSTTKNLVVS